MLPNRNRLQEPGHPSHGINPATGRSLSFLSHLAPLLGLVLVPLLQPVDGRVSAQEVNAQRPSLAVGALEGNLDLDGVLSEGAWKNARAIEGLTMIEPVEGGPVTGHTRVRVLANSRYLVIGIQAADPDPSGIVSTSKARDPQLRAEDYVKVVLDPFLDGRTGYIFALNPGGARYDALVANRGEGEDSQWPPPPGTPPVGPPRSGSPSRA